MKQFKRKMARLLGLALRSDLDRVQEAYEEAYERSEHYLADIMTITDPNADFEIKHNLERLYNYQREMEKASWRGKTTKDLLIC